MGDSKNPDRHTTRDSGEHGNTTDSAASTVKALRHGTPLPRAALEVRKEVVARYNEAGPSAMIQDGAIDAEMVCELYLQAVVQAAEMGQRPRLHEAVKTWAYLRNTATKHWQLVGNAEKVESGMLDITAAVAAAQETAAEEAK